MNKRFPRWVGLVALGAALFTADRANAQLYGVGGVGGIGGPAPFGAFGPYATRPFGTFGTFGPGTFGPGFGGLYGTNPYAFSQFGLATPYNPYLGSLYDPGFRWPGELYGSVAPTYQVAPGSLYYGGFTAPAGSAYYSMYPPAQTTIKINNAQDKPSGTVSSVQVKVPNPNAEVWFGGVKTKQTGTQRQFITPTLEPGKTYKYQVRAAWKEKGVDVEHNQTVSFQPGQNVTVDFTGPAATEGKKAEKEKQEK